MRQDGRLSAWCGRHAELAHRVRVERGHRPASAVLS
jgi:hypothetical protein